MRSIIVFGFILGFACFLVFATALPAWACHCPSQRPRQHFKKAKLVFQGVAERETVDSHIFFKVEKTWKGLADVQEVDLKFRNLERCGVNPTMGHSFVIFSGPKGFDSCDIKETIDSEREISFLNAVNPVKPVDDPPK